MTIGTNSVRDWTWQASDWSLLVDFKGAERLTGRRNEYGSGSRARGGEGLLDASAVLKAISETDVRG